MFSNKFLSRTITLVIVFMLAVSSISPVFAAPSNDNFAGATVITSLPLNTNADTTGATFEVDEPASCTAGYPLKTVWFSYTPPTTTSLTARVSYGGFPTLLAIYTGSSLNTLTQINCSYYYNSATFQAQGGVTYYFQMSSFYDWYEGNIPFSLEVTPPPVVNLYYYPSDPSTFDNVSFNSSIYDPGQIYGLTYIWTISDGANSIQSGFNHQFAADGDYTVNLKVTTADGRSGQSPSQIVQVRTKDVAISKFTIPQTAKVNTTKTITVDVLNKRYSDSVQVALYKGLPGGGEQLIGVLTIFVPAKAKQATSFKFTYTFTSQDASIGKVTFKAVATLVNGRDALPTDNTFIDTTKVTGSSYP